VLVAFWIQLALVAWDASFGGFTQAGVIRAFGDDDKMLHFLVFAAVGLTALWLWRSAWPVVAVFFAFAGFMEVAQQLLPDHEAPLADFGASAVGLLAAWTAFRAAATFRDASA